MTFNYWKEMYDNDYKMTFNYWKEMYDNDKLEDFNFNPLALLWLKIKSIIRKELVDNFIQANQLTINATSLNGQFLELYDLLSQDLDNAHEKLDGFIRLKNSEQVAKLDTEKLESELYKLRYFDWGGDYKNALDKYLVDRYIKVYSNYDELVAKLDTEINRAVQGYVLCSWYNHWSSILIEHLFKSHSVVLPTVGQIKKVDFFVNNIPFDLKVTYLPTNFIESRRKAKDLKPELTELKQKAKQAQIQFDTHARVSDVYYEIAEKMKDKNDAFCQETLQNIKSVRLEILQEVIETPRMLIQNLYEQQGELRFDAANRLFLVLVDTEDFDNSWKLKRNLNLLKPNIQHYLDNFLTKEIDNLKVSFHYKDRKQPFQAISDIIFVVK